MEVVVAVALAFGVAWLISSIGAKSIDAAVGALAQFLGGWRPDPWPRGVQEEDRDRPWGARRLVPFLRDTPVPDPKPTMSRVQPTVSHR